MIGEVLTMKTAADFVTEIEKTIYFVPNYKYRYFRVQMYIIARNMILRGEY
jgi:hypothetical protein